MSARTHNSLWSFARKERRGTFLILSLIILLSAAPFLLPFIYKGSIAGQVNIDTALANLKTKQASTARTKKYPSQYEEEDRRPYDHPSSYPARSYTIKGTLFYFDPNTLDEAGWIKLGMREKTIATILNYRNKGGRFRQPEDIKKIWGIFPDEAERLMPYIQISESIKSNPSEFSATSGSAPGKTFVPKAVAVVNINSADSNALDALPGIGAKLSQRILNFRNKLGGFYSVEQVAETFGLPDSTFQKIKPYLQLDGTVKKININTASLDELKAHPYIRYHLGNAIVQYRTQHGPYQNLHDLSKIMIMDAATLQKLMPYLTLQ